MFVEMHTFVQELHKFDKLVQGLHKFDKFVQGLQ
jgi:hypothetical protein